MQGFDERFDSPPSYILGVTEEIWEQQGVDRLRDYYTDDIPVRSPDGFVIGSEAVIEATWATLREFPDRQLLGEDVIWSDDGEGGFMSSHRIFSTATHSGDGAFGKATGTKLQYRVIADCAARSNQIYDEWLVRDLSAVATQLGYGARDFATLQIDAQGGIDHAVRPAMSQDDPPHVYTGRGNHHPAGERYVASLRSMATGTDAPVRAIYDRAAQLEVPGGRTLHGWAGAETFWSGLRTAVPDARLDIHHVIGREDESLGERAAVRWSLMGTHSGPGAFGAPTGAPLHIMGISHADYGPWGLRREFVLFDEIAVWKQILMA